MTRQCKIRPECCCLKWETPVPGECGPAAFWGWTDSPSNGLDSEWQKHLDDAIAELPRARCWRNGVWPRPNTYPRPQGSQEPSPEYPAANTAPVTHPRHGSTMPAKQGSLRATLAWLRNCRKTIQLLCKACRVTEGHVWHVLLSRPSQSAYSLFLHGLEVLFSYFSFNCRKWYIPVFYLWSLESYKTAFRSSHGSSCRQYFPFVLPQTLASPSVEAVQFSSVQFNVAAQLVQNFLFLGFLLFSSHWKPLLKAIISQLAHVGDVD